MSSFGFNAMLSRMKYIRRWNLMRSSIDESLCEHSADTAILAHTLCLIANKMYNKNVNSEKVCTVALYHDASEILTGDMPTPVKYKNDVLHDAYKKLEVQAANQLSLMLPIELQEEMQECLTASTLTDYEKKLLKGADRLSALIKCINERQSGNYEFKGAEKQQCEALIAMQCEEINYFMQNMLDSYEQNLDELTSK